MARVRFAGVLAASLLLTSAAAVDVALAAPSAQERWKAHKHATEGRKHEWKKDWQAARDAYRAAFDLLPSAANRVRLGRALIQLGELREAETILLPVQDDKRAAWNLKAKAKKYLSQIDAKLATLTLDLPEDFTGTVVVAGRKLEFHELATPIRLEPGAVAVEVTADGYLPFREEVMLTEGEKSTLAVLLEAEPKPKPKPVKKAVPEDEGGGHAAQTWGTVGLIVGGAGLVAGTYFGLSARSKRSELDDDCPGDVCTRAQRDTYDQGKQHADYATIGFIVGAVGIGTGAVLLLSSGDDDGAKPGDVQALVGPTGASLRGKF